MLFLSFEIAAGKEPSEPGIADRLDCFGSGIDLTHYMMGDLTGDEQRSCESSATLHRQRVPDRPADRPLHGHRAGGRHRAGTALTWCTSTGFTSWSTARRASRAPNWEGHDNLANDLKKLGMNHMIPIVITHQVREKQLTGKKGAGIDDGAMMGGTAIIMYADLVLGVDVDDDKLRTLSCTRSRLKYLDTVHGTWDWRDCTFHEQEAQVDPGQFGYGKEDDNDGAPF